MRKIIKNKAHPVLNIASRNIKKSEFDNAYSLYRANKRYSLVGTDLFTVCHFVKRDANHVDQLLVKSVRLAINIEQTQIGVAA